MKVFDSTYLKTSVATMMKARANKGIWQGGQSYPPYFEQCRGQHILLDVSTLLVFTRDTGYHSGGWWKNPDYENCYHLSLSFLDTLTLQPMPKESRLTQEWINLFFGDNKRLVWSEPPYSEVGIARDVWHYRLFCNQNWAPIKPRGEVYTRHFTERGWKSFSDLTHLQP